MKTKWVGHYTGIDILDLQHWKVIHPYFQRDRKTKKLQFARIGYNVPWSRYWRNIGIFIGRQNYASNYVTGGYQIFTNLFHFGIGHKRRSILPREAFKIDYSGSRVDPYYHISYIFFNCITFGFDTPKWFRNWRRVQDMKRWEQMPDPFGEDYDDDGTMTNPEQERWVTAMLWKEVMEYIGDDIGLTWTETEKKLASLFEKMSRIMDISVDSAKKTFYEVANVNIGLAADLAMRYLEMERHNDRLKITAKHIIKHTFMGNKTGSC